MMNEIIEIFIVLILISIWYLIFNYYDNKRRIRMSEEIMECARHGKRTQMIHGKCVLCLESENKRLVEALGEVEAELSIFRQAFPHGAKIIKEAKEKGFDEIKPLPEAEGEAEKKRLVEALEAGRALVKTYREKTPLGNQPHMIAGKADDWLQSLPAEVCETECGRHIAKCSQCGECEEV